MYITVFGLNKDSDRPPPSLWCPLYARSRAASSLRMHRIFRFQCQNMCLATNSNSCDLCGPKRERTWTSFISVELRIIQNVSLQKKLGTWIHEKRNSHSEWTRVMEWARQSTMTSMWRNLIQIVCCQVVLDQTDQLCSLPFFSLPAVEGLCDSGRRVDMTWHWRMAGVTIGLELQNSAGKTPSPLSHQMEILDHIRTQRSWTNKDIKSTKKHVPGLVEEIGSGWAAEHPITAEEEDNYSRPAVAVILHEIPLLLTLYLLPTPTPSDFSWVNVLIWDS